MVKIKHIFISHLHGDHFFGLVGLISTFRLHTRETDLHIYAPKGLKEVITLQMKLADSWTNFKLIFHELKSKESELIFEDDKDIAWNLVQNQNDAILSSENKDRATADGTNSRWCIVEGVSKVRDKVKVKIVTPAK